MPGPGPNRDTAQSVPGEARARRDSKGRIPESTLAPYLVSAFNTAKASENKIHDEATAQRLGFSGGFVGGVNIYAYMTHQPLRCWGRAWLERGTGEAKFIKPVYENDIAEITAIEDAEGLALTVHSQGVLCSTGRAAISANLLAFEGPELADFELVSPLRPRSPPELTNSRSRSVTGSG